MSIGTFPFSQAVVDIITTDEFFMVYACELFFEEETLRFHSGTGQLVLDGYTYTGVGDFGGITAVEEDSQGTSPKSITLSLSGLNSSILSDSLYGAKGRDAKIYLVVADKSGTQAADVLFQGRMDAPLVSYGGNDGSNSINITVIDRMDKWNRVDTERWTDESHTSRNGADDRFFYAVKQLADAPIYWGYKKDAPSFEYTVPIPAR
jgi:hypothetical protein